MTIAVIASAFALLIAYDVYAFVTKADKTISERSLEISKQYPIFPFLIGVILGHLFWPQ